MSPRAVTTQHSGRDRSGSFGTFATLREPRVSQLVVGVLIAAFFLQALLSSIQKSATSDETVHVTAGLSYLATGRIVVNQEHPPLLKEISGLFLRMAGVSWPHSDEAAALATGNLPLEPAVSTALFVENGPDKVLFWSRLPLIMLAAAYAYVLFLFGRALLGQAAAIGATALYVVDPNIVAHGSLVTTDVGMTGFTILVLMALWHYLQRPGWQTIIWAGLALGAALCTKFSAIALLPIGGALLAAAAFWPIELPGSRGNADNAPVSRNARCPCGSGRKYKNCHGQNREASAVPGGPAKRLIRYTGAAMAMCAVAAIVIHAVYLFPTDPLQYIDGYRLVNANHQTDFKAYMAGHLQHRFYSYCLLAYLLKEPLASVILSLIGTIILLRKRPRRILMTAFLLLPPGVLFAGYTLYSDNLGFRYLIPVLPFAYILGGLALATLFQSVRTWKRVAAGVLYAWLIIAAVGIYPDHLSYFNEVACLFDRPGNIGLDGGSRCGTDWLGDSNVDWGQGLKQLKTWLDRNAPGKTIHLGYFGPLPPERYGIKYEPMDDSDYVSPRQPGLYVVSAFYAAPLPAVIKEKLGAGGEWLRSPNNIVAHAFHVYNVPATATNTNPHDKAPAK